MKRFNFFHALVLGLMVARAGAVEPPAPRLTPVTNTFNGTRAIEWSVKMAQSEMARRGDKLAWTEGGKARWDYTAGLFTLSLLKLNEQMPDAAYVSFVTNAIGSFIGADGSIQGYKPEEYQLDALNSGKTVLALWPLMREERYRKCASLLREQLNRQPRTAEGGFWHKQRYTNQMWLDGLYMAAPFYAEFTKLNARSKSDYDDVAKQFKLVEEHLYDPHTGLYYHAWDSKKVQAWANPVTGTSSNFWGRAEGWYAMALVDVLDFMPTNHPARADLIGQIKKVAEGVLKYQDANTGLWWQVLDQGDRKGNYQEATASCMFVYALAKAVNQGYLPATDYKAAALKGYRGILDKLIRKEDNGAIDLTQCCAVAGLGTMGKSRDGSFNYYVSEPIIENDLKGVGPFILAGIEVEKLIR